MKLLLTGVFRYTERQMEYIKSLGYDVKFIQDERLLIDFDVSDIEAVVCNGLFLYTPIEKFENLRFIQLTSAGLDRIPLDYIKEHDIKVFNAKGVYSIPMAEFAVGGVLQLYKQFDFFRKNQMQHKWEKSRNLIELSGKNILIVGAGNIGSQVAKRFKAFDANVIGIDLHPNDDCNFDNIYPVDKLDTMLPDADVIILTLPLMKETQGFFNKNKFALMKKSAVFVNISRGKLVNQTDLIFALENQVINGAVLDVFEDEPLTEDSPLWDMPNTVITPHNSFVGDGNNERMFNLISKNLEGFLNE